MDKKEFDEIEKENKRIAGPAIPYQSYLLNEDECEMIKKIEYDIRDRMSEVFGLKLPEDLNSRINYIVSQTFIAAKSYYKD